MAELNLKQIAEKLNIEFAGDTRRLVFWYDANAEFAEDVDSLELVSARVLHLEPDNQFYIKYFLEYEDTETNYLVYAPFAKPGVRENHLADTIRYSKEFFVDKASVITMDLGIDERNKYVIQHYIKFFGNKKRTQDFYDLEIDTYNRNTIEIAMMSVLCRCKTPSFEEVLRVVITTGAFEENQYLDEFGKYDLLDAFWRLTEDNFGYIDESPTLEKLAMMMFVTYTSKYVSADLPDAWQPFISIKMGNNSIAFLDNLMNSYLYGERFDEISELVYNSLKAESELSRIPIESLVSCGIYEGIDKMLLKWLIERLEIEDIAAKLGDFDIPQIVKMRRQGHFGKKHHSAYFVIENAWHIISGAQYVSSGSLNDLAKRYTEDLYQMDRRYRYFYYYLDKIEDTEQFEKLKNLVENIYTNSYLSKVCINWNELLSQEAEQLQMTKQVDFYKKYVEYANEQIVVIISDAMRYEVGVSLLEKLHADEKCTTDIKTMISVLPSVTPYGMAALLPHRKLEVTDSFDILIDGKKNDTMQQRQDILQKYKLASRCVGYDDIRNMSVADLRSIFTRQDVVYVYHDQIDARGDKKSTENEVFNACEEAIEEISALIRRLTTSANRSHFIVTSDHGFIYKRDTMTESNKISDVYNLADKEGKGRRYMISGSEIKKEGISSITMGTLMGNDDRRKVSYPVGTDILKIQGSGINYVHGGSSPQEMILPVIDVRTEKAHKKTETVQIALVSLTTKITNLITSLDFVQTEPISDVIKETTYRIYFVDANGEKISNEHLYIADRKNQETVKRVFRLRFMFKDRKYNKSQKYYLVAYDDNNSMEVLRHEIIMDIAFADDFGFGF